MLTSSQIRQSFLDFFREKEHTIVPSASLLPDSPNLLFTNAGMNQFVPIFLGLKLPDVSKWAGARPGRASRAADTQKCIRAGGKHNDLDDVGLDTYHHTFFEMLGNWSFGDYFKREAIDWAWELVVERWKFPANRLYATVYHPDQAAGDPSEFDQEAWDFWAEKFRIAGLDPAVHIVSGNKNDNFWMMGDTGPCGPCSELHVDLTPQGGTRGALVNQGDARCIEIWNLVFIQFNANADGTFSPLPARHVDTGMGFERVASIIQGTKGFTNFISAKISNYETDIFRPIFDELERMSGKRYTSTLPGEQTRVSQSGEHTRPRVSQSAPSPIAAVNVESTAGAPSTAREGACAPRAGTSEPVYSRRCLTHFERPWAKYMVTFSTIDRRKLAPAERDLVLKSILHAERERQYHLYIACVMPDHVHLLFEPQIKDNADEGNPVFWSLSEILQGIKSTSAHAINKARGRKGPVWEKESLDRMIRSESDLEEKFRYICRNPWDEAVVRDSESYNWLWTFASDEGSGEHTRPRVSQSAPSPIAAVNVESTAGAPSTAREGACAPQNSQSPRHAQIEQEKIDVAFRVIADHIRTLSFAIADGIQPGNTDRNYVLRRILRRAVRYGRTLGFHEPFFYKLVDVLARTMGDVFPEIRLEQKHIEEVLRREEEAFGKTLDKGLAIFESAIHPVETTTTATREPGETAITHSTYLRRNQLAVNEVSASLAFQLYDTYGFPLDLTELMARERGLSVDTPGFEKLMEEQRARARKAQKKQVIELSQIETTAPTRFVGYDMLSTTARVLEVVGVKERTAVVLDRSCAYAEMGGQVGDTGELIHGGQLWRLVNTQKSGNTWLHLIEDTSSADESAPRDAQQSDRNGHAPHPAHGMEVHLTVDANRRQAIERHHTVTHLLHWALHEVVSRDATQKGSYVGPEKLTFDFNSAALTPVQLRDVERLVNERIVENTGVSWTEVPYSEIKSRVDILQFFGDRYGDSVRVVQIGGEAGALNGYSMELCAGTHTRATGQIGLFRIAGEAAIAAGVRRIEAVAGLQACDMMHAEAERLKQLAAKLGAPVPELERKLDALLTQQKELEKILKSARQREASTRARELLAMATNQVIVANLGDVDGDYAMAVAEALKGLFNGIIVLGATGGGNVALIANVPTELQSRIQAGKIIQAIAPMVGGKGGGKPDFARGGGREPGKLEEALAEARRLCGLGS